MPRAKEGDIFMPAILQGTETLCSTDAAMLNRCHHAQPIPPCPTDATMPNRCHHAQPMSPCPTDATMPNRQHHAKPTAPCQMVIRLAETLAMDLSCHPGRPHPNPGRPHPNPTPVHPMKDPNSPLCYPCSLSPVLSSLCRLSSSLSSALSFQLESQSGGATRDML